MLGFKVQRKKHCETVISLCINLGSQFEFPPQNEILGHLRFVPFKLSFHILPVSFYVIVRLQTFFQRA